MSFSGGRPGSIIDVDDPFPSYDIRYMPPENCMPGSCVNILAPYLLFCFTNCFELTFLQQPLQLFALTIYLFWRILKFYV